MNRKFGKLVNGSVVYAPESLTTKDGIVLNPTDERYLADGWKRVVDEPPVPEDGFESVVSFWTEDEGSVIARYKQVRKEPPPVVAVPAPGVGAAGDGVRVFSKLKLVIALKKANLWILTKTWIEENGLYDLYLAAQDVREDNEWFVRGVSELKTLAKKTDAEVEEILAACVAE